MNREEVENGGDDMLIDRDEIEQRRLENAVPEGFNADYLKAYYGNYLFVTFWFCSFVYVEYHDFSFMSCSLEFCRSSFDLMSLKSITCIYPMRSSVRMKLQHILYIGPFLYTHLDTYVCHEFSKLGLDICILG